MTKKKIKLLNVTQTKWGFYDAYEIDDRESMASYFEILLHHYKDRGKKIKELKK